MIDDARPGLIYIDIDTTVFSRHYVFSHLNIISVSQLEKIWKCGSPGGPVAAAQDVQKKLW